jgi:uncharacterized membrane protein HdeD (DUF308 family)
MLREGPIPRFVHGLLEYVAGVLFVIAPFVLSFEAGAAIAASLIVGVVLLVVAASTDGSTSLVNQIPLPAHVVLDYVLAVALLAIPFVAGFSDETAPTAFFIALGVIHLLVTIGTRFRKEDRPSRRDRGRRRGSLDAPAGDSRAADSPVGEPQGRPRGRGR